MTNNQILDFKEKMHPSTLVEVYLFKWFIKTLDNREFLEEYLPDYIKYTVATTEENKVLKDLSKLSLDKFIAKYPLLILKVCRSKMQLTTRTSEIIEFRDEMLKSIPISIVKSDIGPLRNESNLRYRLQDKLNSLIQLGIYNYPNNIADF